MGPSGDLLTVLETTASNDRDPADGCRSGLGPATRSRGRGARTRAPATASLLFLMFAAVAAGLSFLAPSLEAQAPEQVPSVDTTRHAVPLEAIVFDTFRPGEPPVPLPEAEPGLIRQLRDAIPPLHFPEYEPAEDAGWLRDDHLVLGYEAGGEAWAYPVRILNLHEIVNDTLAGTPVLVSYCPLCASGVVFDRRLEGDTLLFGNTSALYESDMVMLDYGTGSYWWQVAGRAIVGPLTGTELTVLPSSMRRWEEWRRLHPETRVLSRKTGYSRDYSRNPFRGFASAVDRGRFPFPVSEDARRGPLSAGTRVLGVKVDGEIRAYPLTNEEVEVVADTLGGEPVAVFLDGEGGGAAFRPRARGRSLLFRVEDGRIVDRETGSRWDPAGRAREGPLAGSRLEPLPTRTSFWFALIAAEPEATVYGR